MRGKWMLLAVSAVLVGIGAGAISLLHREAASKAQPARAAEPTPPAMGDISLPAKIQAQQVVSVAPQIAGEILELLVEPGQEVYEGELLVRISNQGLQTEHETATTAGEVAQARLSKAESAVLAARMEASRARADAMRSRSDLELADKVYRRQKFLYSEGATPRLVYEKSEKEFESAKQQHESLEALAKQTEERVDALNAEAENARKILADKLKALEDATAHMQAGEVHSPVNGLVVALKGEPGKAVHPGEGNEIVSIAVNLSELQAVVEAHPSFLKRIKPGQQMMVFLADVPGEGVPGTVKEVAGDQAVVTFTSPSSLIKPGTTAQVRMRVE
jgi:HlyD family secretion protein